MSLSKLAGWCKCSAKFSKIHYIYINDGDTKRQFTDVSKAAHSYFKMTGANIARVIVLSVVAFFFLFLAKIMYKKMARLSSSSRDIIIIIIII